jgi:UDP-N-acetyl-D-glucosamine dehydrogenase
MTKLLENIFRCVNIALVNELALLCKRMNINIWEVVELASTKPYGFMPFYPGPGLGGHCIPIDPFYLTWKAKEFDFQTKFIELAGEINLSMPYFIVNMVQDALSSRNKTVSNSRVLLLGMAYKKDIDDPRESPAIKIYELLARKDAKVDYNDDFVKEIIINDRKIKSVSLDALDDYDCVVITTDHTYYDIKDIVKRSKLLVDSRNASRGIISENIFIL